MNNELTFFELLIIFISGLFMNQFIMKHESNLNNVDKFIAFVSSKFKNINDKDLKYNTLKM